MSNAFIFVVCGDREHIETLHYSLQSFRLKSRLPLIVVTDSGRNEIKIIHDTIFDIRTPAELDHHQASIYLKTSLHKILPKGVRYAYMDSDILAVGDYIDSIFEEYLPPIRFAPDHCAMPSFSPSAMNCSCKQEYDQLISAIQQHISEIDPLVLADDDLTQSKRRLLQRQLAIAFKNKPSLLLKGIKYLLSWPLYKFSKEFYFNRKTNIWEDAEGHPVMTNIKWSKVARKFGLRFNYLTFDIKFPNGQSIWINQCNHLQEGIQRKFKVPVKNPQFHHWNGGVFLFDDQSHDFLDYWHNATLEIFSDSEWKTRDQGTLIATVWKFGLEHHPALDEKWNFICDYNNPLFGYRADDRTLTKDQKKYVRPEFAHVYHHFGDQSWDFWNWITRELK